MEIKKKIAVIDYELVFDVWSLMFCILRMDNPAFTNQDYDKVLNKNYRNILTPER